MSVIGVAIGGRPDIARRTEMVIGLRNELVLPRLKIKMLRSARSFSDRCAPDGAGSGGCELRDQTSAIIRCAELRTDLLRGIRRSPPTAGVHADFYLDGGRHQTSYEPRH